MCKVSAHCRMSNKKKKILLMQCVMTTPEIQDTLCMLYAKAAKRQDMNFQDYCRHVWTLNKDQCHIVMYNRAWYKSYINTVRHGENQGYRIFLTGQGGREKSCCTSYTKRHVQLFQTQSETWWWSTYCPHNFPNRISSISNWWIYNPFHISITW